MKITAAILFAFSSLVQIAHAQNSWTQKADFGGSARRSAVGFAIGANGYIGTGYDNNFYDDLWKYDPVANAWTQVASCPAAARFSAVAFVISAYAYVGTGYDVNNNFNTGDFWRYDALNNSWSQAASLPTGAERRYASAFAAQGRGYVVNGVGPAGYLNDLWEYDAGGNAWIQKANFPGAVRYECVSFNIGEFGYVGCGAMAGTIYNDFYEYQPQNNSWIQKANYPGTGGDAPAGFALERRGYIGTGSTQGSFPTDFYEWDQLTDTWTAKANFPAAGRAFGTGFSILDKGYMGLGEGGGYFNDWWEYVPDSLFSSVSAVQGSALRPEIIIAGREIMIHSVAFNSSMQFRLYHSDGKLTDDIEMVHSHGRLSKTLSPGIYFYSLTGKAGIFSGKLFIAAE